MYNYSKRMDYMANTANIIKELFSTTTDPDMISLGIGSPANEGLPVEIVHQICDEVMTRESRGVEALQYNAVKGVMSLRQAVCDRLLKPRGIDADPNNVIITTGGLETMNMICQLFIDEGDVILCESPVFVHSVEIFEMFQAKCIPCETDDEGIVPADVEAKIKEYNPKIIYVNPTFQNPSGRTLNAERRKQLAELGDKYGVIVLEDDPYRDIRYSGEEMPLIKEFDKTGHTVEAGSFSKIFSPGSRLGYVYADADIIEKMADVKSATNSHTSALAQVICSEFFTRGYYDEHLAKVKEIHRKRRDKLIECIDKYMPEGTKRVFPDGGLFTWVELPKGINTTELLKDARAEKHVSFVAGAGFFVQGGGMGDNCMRLSFGNISEEKIEIAMQRLGDLINEKYLDKIIK